MDVALSIIRDFMSSVLDFLGMVSCLQDLANSTLTGTKRLSLTHLLNQDCVRIRSSTSEFTIRNSPLEFHKNILHFVKQLAEIYILHFS